MVTLTFYICDLSWYVCSFEAYVNMYKENIYSFLDGTHGGEHRQGHARLTRPYCYEECRDAKPTRGIICEYTGCFLLLLVANF